MTFKTGDKGETRCGVEYEVIAVLDRPLAIGGNVVAIIRLSRGWFLQSYHSDGRGDPPRQDRYDLMPSVVPTQAKPTIHEQDGLIIAPHDVVQLNPDGSVTIRPAYDPRTETPDTRAGCCSDV